MVELDNVKVVRTFTEKGILQSLERQLERAIDNSEPDLVAQILSSPYLQQGLREILYTKFLGYNLGTLLPQEERELLIKAQMMKLGRRHADRLQDPNYGRGGNNRPILKETLWPDVPYIPFPKNPKIITVENLSVLEYITPEIMNEYIIKLAEKFNFGDYEHVLVNLNGGEFLFRKLAKIKDYKGEAVRIKYNRPPGGFGVIETIRIPTEIRNTKSLVVEDVLGSGGTISHILSCLSKDSLAVMVVTKRGIKNQIKVHNALVAVSIDNRWAGGCGMEMIDGIQGERIREHGGIVAKISENDNKQMNDY